MVETTNTEFWNDSCSISELEYAIAHGAVGATTNPVIVLNVLKKEMSDWRDRILEIISENPTADETVITWKLIEEMAVKGAGLLEPVFLKENGKKGRLSIQTNPMFYRNAGAMTEQAVRFNGLAPNMQVKIPATHAGVVAIREATRKGVSINATVSFTVPQALAVAEAVEQGLNDRIADGNDISTMNPVCTIMVGRLDDWLKVVAEKEGILPTPGSLEWAGVAAFKRAYSLYRERGYRTKLLAAAYRNHLHWSQLIGGPVVLTIPAKWQRHFNASSIPVVPRLEDPVDPGIITELEELFIDFRRAYEPDGMDSGEFDGYGATVRTLRSFVEGYIELLSTVRNLLLPNPDV
ncbi:MAG: transaldolase family protein [Spirochaetales bacterium]|nr:transaldolase family protein [Spirochaetales bacterium]